jgi:MOSC domain-containing protein YiiM
MSGRIVQISISATGGVPKRPVEAAQVATEGVVGNAVAHPEVHGGPDRALCLYSEEHILALQHEGHPIKAGSVGENVTIAGLDWKGLCPGTKLALGERVKLEITSYAAPCNTIAGAFADRDSLRIAQRKHPGWSRLYARVLVPGTIRAGDPVRVLSGALAEPVG